MPGLNTTGAADPQSYSLGRGRVYFAELTSGRPSAGGWRDLGNCPQFNISVAVETLKHQSSRSGLKVTDKEVVISQEISVSFQLDEINFQNLALALAGSATAAALTNPAIAGVADIQLTSSVVLGRWYDLTSLPDGAGVRLYDVATANISFKGDPSGADTTLVEDTDYTLDEKMGRVFFLSTAANLTATDAVEFTATADAGAVAPDEVKALTQTTVLGALKFIGENPANNDAQAEYQFHQIQLESEGDLPLIGDEFTVIGQNGVAERNETADADSPTLTIRTHANA